MEENNPSSLFELVIDHESSSFLNETARWGKFLSIVGFVTCGLLAVASFFIGSIMSRSALASYSADGAGAYGAGFAAGITAVYLAIAVLYFFPCLYLYRFSVRLKAALNGNDQVQLNQALKNQKSLFKFIGILTIIVLAFYALALIVIVIGSLFGHH
jgi:Family of unknown function (DUF5362)